ncbi:MAG: hypothetical protein ACQEWU_02595 [Bacillota bacterium]|uniref:hypothetical protein n=1 Tax=Virgibacillus TaxID=84406 RepID=UPI0003FB821D|nr:MULTISPECIES: hypothetical protein [Bacillaceae]MCC2250304.1 hypothetical protein [Virgibacillus sp. AGTR]QRZ19795.1 hypothetical protein JUJ52_09240 [Virgibacillus sp. AGTR]
MFKYNIGFPILLFVTITLKQFFFNNYINWIDNIGLSILVFLFYNFWEWSKKSYQWHKDKN